LLRPQNRKWILLSAALEGGTSALDAYLREHPEICMADTKYIFDDETIFRNMSPDYSIIPSSAL
jgi:hypothetical protein